MVSFVKRKTRTRQLMVQALYSYQMNPRAVALLKSELLESVDEDAIDPVFFEETLTNLLAEQKNLQAEFLPLLARVGTEPNPIEAAILMLGVYELKHCLETPVRVVLNECIELAKAYGSAEGHRFVNGILHQLGTRLRLAEFKTA